MSELAEVSLHVVNGNYEEVILDIFNKLKRGVLLVHGDMNDVVHPVKGAKIERDGTKLQFENAPYHGTVFATKVNSIYKYTFWI